MSNRPKSISIQQLSGAVHSAVGRLKVKPPPVDGPWLIINPGIICGLIFNGPIVEAEGVAASIAKELSGSAGVPLAPIVQQEGAAGGALAAKIPPGHIICGFKHDLQVSAT